PVRRPPHTPEQRGHSPPASGWPSAPLPKKTGCPRPAAVLICGGPPSCPCAPRLVPPAFRREVHGLIGFFHHFTGSVEKIPSGTAGRTISGANSRRPPMVDFLRRM